MQPSNHQSIQPSVAQLFGSNYNPDYIQHLPELVQFDKPIPLIPDFTRTKQLIKEYVHKYDLQLMQKYPAEIGRNGKMRPSRSYTLRRLNSGTMATLDALLEMYGAWCISAANGANTYPEFKIRPSAVMSRRYWAVKSANTINDHLERLEESGIIQISGMQYDQSYHVTFNKEVLSARPDKNFTKIIVDNILSTCPELALDEKFVAWTKRLKPSFFAVTASGGTQFLRAYMIFKIHNSNTLKAEFVNVGETAFPTTPPSFPRSKGASENQALPQLQGPSLGAPNPKNEDEAQKEIIAFKVARCWDIAKSCSFWNKRSFTTQQINITKQFLRLWVENHIRENGIKSNYPADVLLPVLRNQERSLRSGKYHWQPPSPDIYFSPDFLTDDGQPAGYQAAVNTWQKLLSKKNIRKGTRKKIKQEKLKEKIFMRWFDFFARIPTVKNMRKAEENIMQLNDDEMLHLFYDAVVNSNLIPTKKLRQETQDKIKSLTEKRIRKYNN